MLDQFVCGLRDHAIKAILFRGEILTFNKAYKLATAAEKAEKNASSTEQPTSSAGDIHAMNVGRSRYEMNQRGQGGDRGRGRARWHRGAGSSGPQAGRGQQAPSTM